jgi:hypothetical protein
VPGGGKLENLSRFFSRLGQRPSEEEAEGTRRVPAASGEGRVQPTKALRKFLACLASRPSPVVLDLGPVVGSNISFFGESIGCKIYVEDLFADLERFRKADKLADLPAFFSKRLRQADASIDGILCWDVFDYLDRPAAQALATSLMRVLRVDGALLAFFGTVAIEHAGFTKYVIVDDTRLQHRAYGAGCPRPRVLANRDIIKLFDGLRVSDSFLLQTNSREILFRKPSYLSTAQLSG